MKNRSKFLLVLEVFIFIFLLHFSNKTIAQCASPIAVTGAAPYIQDFESNNGGWTTGGTLSDWTWGAPTKTTISGAGSGSKCWITGGLSAASTYNLNERSWVQSPCLNLSAIAHPYIKFLAFWETASRLL